MSIFEMEIGRTIGVKFKNKLSVRAMEAKIPD